MDRHWNHLAVSIPQAIAADKQIKLRYGSAYRESMWIGKTALNWIEKIKQDTNGRVIIEPFMGGTLISNQNAVAEVLGVPWMSPTLRLF